MGNALALGDDEGRGKLRKAVDVRMGKPGWLKTSYLATGDNAGN